MAFARYHPARVSFQGLLSCLRAQCSLILCTRSLVLLQFPPRGLYLEFRDCTTSCAHDAQLTN